MRYLISALAFAATIGACSDPVHDGRIKALGDELANVPVGEFHRAGQACVVCHSKDGPASNKVFSVAGTIFGQPGPPTGVDGVTVAFTDSAGSQYTTQTNCVGNFFVTPEKWDPAFPVLVRIYKGDRSKTMQGQIGRERSCGYCHHDPFNAPQQYQGTVLDPQYSSVGHIYLLSAADPPPAPAMNCPVNPTLGNSR
jgi:cytochrome c553